MPRPSGISASDAYRASTRRGVPTGTLGSARNHLLDEYIADYRGIVAATGRFRSDWFLRFMGLENYPDYRRGGRLENYRGDPPLSDKGVPYTPNAHRTGGGKRRALRPRARRITSHTGVAR